MKYKAQYIEDEGKWAVTAKAGKEYFPNTLSPHKVDAERLAREYSMHWHFQQMTNLFSEGQDKGQFSEEDNWGDIVA